MAKLKNIYPGEVLSEEFLIPLLAQGVPTKGVPGRIVYWIGKKEHLKGAKKDFSLSMRG